MANLIILPIFIYQQEEPIGVCHIPLKYSIEEGVHTVFVDLNNEISFEKKDNFKSISIITAIRKWNNREMPVVIVSNEKDALLLKDSCVSGIKKASITYL